MLGDGLVDALISREGMMDCLDFQMGVCLWRDGIKSTSFFMKRGMHNFVFNVQFASGNRG